MIYLNLIQFLYCKFVLKTVKSYTLQIREFIIVTENPYVIHYKSVILAYNRKLKKLVDKNSSLTVLTNSRNERLYIYSSN